jgi:deoxyribonuclease II
MLRITLLFSLGFLGLADSFSCLNEYGQSVDWWLSIKTPAGTTYSYYDPVISSFGLSKHSLNDTTVGSLAYTLQQIWKEKPAAYVVYNDEVPGESSYSYTYGHTKGLFAFGSNGEGFWLPHSVPGFPVAPGNVSEYQGLPGSAYTYAQNFLCLSVSAETLDSIAYKFLLNRPHIYDFLFPDPLSALYPNISKLVSGDYSDAAICGDSTLETSGGQPFQIFAKSKAWNQDLWSACVAPALKSDVWVESWIRGSAEGPACPTNGYNTLDVKGLDFGFANGSWSETQDHSKWGLAVNASRVCFGDINRMTTQYARGGGTACWEDNYMASVLGKAIIAMDSCN